jgi:hypothetical protein
MMVLISLIARAAVPLLHTSASRRRSRGVTAHLPLLPRTEIIDCARKREKHILAVNLDVLSTILLIKQETTRSINMTQSTMHLPPMPAHLLLQPTMVKQQRQPSTGIRGWQRIRRWQTDEGPGTTIDPTPHRLCTGRPQRVMTMTAARQQHQRIIEAEMRSED